jgi:hypothetical protein
MKRCSSRSWYATAAVFIVLLVLSSIGGPAGGPARYLSVVLLPGVSILLLVFGDRMGVSEACLFGGALSPVVLTLVAIPFILGGWGLESVPALLNVFFLLVLIAGLFTRGSSERRESIPVRSWLGALVLAALIVVPLLVNPALRMRSDAWFHAAVAESVGRSGLPPDDPYYAGIQLRYFWAYHVYLLVLRSAVPASLFDLMAVTNAFFFPIYLLSILALSSRISTRRSGPFFSVALAVFGVNVFGSLLLAGRVLLGDTRGLDVLRGIVDGGSHYVLMNLAYGYVGSISFFLDKFLVGSPFAMTLAMFLIAVYFLLGWLVSGSRRELVLAGLFAISAILFHTIIGLSLLLCGGGALAAVSLWGARARDGTTARRALIGLALLGVAALLCVPYLRSIIASRGPGPGPFTINGIFLWTAFAAGLLPLVFFAARAKMEGIKGTGTLFILFLTCFALILGIFARMPLGNINKIVYLVLLPLVVLAGDGVPLLLPLFRRAPRLGAGLIIFLVASGFATVALGLSGYIRERGSDIPVRLKNGRIDLTAAERDAYRWMREQTPRQSIFINDSRLDIPVMASRRQIWAPNRYADAWGYRDDEIRWRREMIGSIYSEAALSREARNRLLAAGFPVYIVMRTGDLRRLAGEDGVPAALGAREVFRNEEFIIGVIDAEQPAR